MAGSTNFVQHNPGAANQEPDSAFDSDSLTTGGIGTDAIMPSAWMNKRWDQDSTFVAAFAQALANKGYVVSDANIATLETVLANVLTNADQKTPLVSVTYSPTPVFPASTSNGFEVILAGNVTSSTFDAAPAIGQILTFVIVQNSSAPFTFTPPTSVNGWTPISTTLNSVNVRQFVVIENGTIWPLGIPTTTMSIVTGSRSFNTVYQNTSGFRMEVSAACQLFGGVGQNANIYGNVAATSSSLAYTGAGAQTVGANSVTNAPGQAGLTFVVPPNYYYTVTEDSDSSGGTPYISYWTEWVN